MKQARWRWTILAGLTLLVGWSVPQFRARATPAPPRDLTVHVSVVHALDSDQRDSVEDPEMQSLIAMLEPILLGNPTASVVDEILTTVDASPLGPATMSGPIIVIYKYFWRPDLKKWVKICCQLFPPLNLGAPPTSTPIEVQITVEETL